MSLFDVSFISLFLSLSLLSFSFSFSSLSHRSQLISSHLDWSRLVLSNPISSHVMSSLEFFRFDLSHLFHTSFNSHLSLSSVFQVPHLRRLWRISHVSLI